MAHSIELMLRRTGSMSTRRTLEKKHRSGQALRLRHHCARSTVARHERFRSPEIAPASQDRDAGVSPFRQCIVEAKIKALGFGADDYMTKPFHKDELVARLHALVRRSKAMRSRPSP